MLEEDANSIKIQDAIVAMPVSEDGQQLGFAPWAPLQDPDLDELEVNRNMVMYITDPAPNLIAQYKKMFNKIVAPEKKLIL